MSTLFERYISNFPPEKRSYLLRIYHDDKRIVKSRKVAWYMAKRTREEMENEAMLRALEAYERQTMPKKKQKPLIIGPKKKKAPAKKKLAPKANPIKPAKSRTAKQRLTKKKRRVARDRQMRKRNVSHLWSRYRARLNAVFSSVEAQFPPVPAETISPDGVVPMETSRFAISKGLGVALAAALNSSPMSLARMCLNDYQNNFYCVGEELGTVSLRSLYKFLQQPFSEWRWRQKGFISVEKMKNHEYVAALMCRKAFVIAPFLLAQTSASQVAQQVAAAGARLFNFASPNKKYIDQLTIVTEALKNLLGADAWANEIEPMFLACMDATSQFRSVPGTSDQIAYFRNLIPANYFNLPV